MKFFHILGNLVLIAVILTVTYIGVTFYLEYRKAKTDPANDTTWKRLVATTKQSHTILWAKFCYLVAGLVSALDYLPDYLGAPEVSNFINTYVGNPKVIAPILMGIAFITIRARLTPKSKDPLD